jgi:uncharacterized RDD family membrane protein YckC
MPSELPPPGFLRRLGAMFYDSLLLLALLMMLSYPYVWLTGGDKPGLTARTLYQIYLLAICFFFYAGFWIRGGQTLGLRTWRLKLVRRDGGPITWTLALKRFAAAWLSLLCFGLGFLWVIFDRDGLAWHDRLTGTRMILLPKPPGRKS